MQTAALKTCQQPQIQSPQTHASAAQETAFQQVFQMIDANNDGSIDANEFADFLRGDINDAVGDYAQRTESNENKGGSQQHHCGCEDAAEVKKLGQQALEQGFFPFESADEGATKILTGDIDGTMNPKYVQTLLDEGYCNVVNGHMICTAKGNELLQFMEKNNGIESQHIIQHIQDHEAAKVSAMGQESCRLGLSHFMSADEPATRVLVGDIDSKMNPHVIDGLIQDGYLQLDGTELKATTRGQELLEFMQTNGSGIKGREVLDHRIAFEASKVAGLGQKAAANGYTPFYSADTAATRFLTGDIDATMNPTYVQAMLDKGYIRSESGHLVTTAKGQALLDFIKSKGFQSQEMSEHMSAFEAVSQTPVLPECALL